MIRIPMDRKVGSKELAEHLTGRDQKVETAGEGLVQTREHNDFLGFGERIQTLPGEFPTHGMTAATPIITNPGMQACCTCAFEPRRLKSWQSRRQAMNGRTWCFDMKASFSCLNSRWRKTSHKLKKVLMEQSDRFGKPVCREVPWQTGSPDRHGVGGARRNLLDIRVEAL